MKHNEGLRGEGGGGGERENYKEEEEMRNEWKGKSM